MLLFGCHAKLKSGVQMSGFSSVACCLFEFVVQSSTSNTAMILSTSLVFRGYFFLFFKLFCLFYTDAEHTHTF